jgi:hypothetical protein
MSNFIQGYCKIRDGNVIVNGGRFFLGSASLNDFFDQLYGHLNPNYPKFYKMDNLSKLGFLACESLLCENTDISSVDRFDISVVLSNSSSSLDTDKKYYESMKKAASPALFVYTLPNIVNGEISIRHGFTGESSFLITPEFDPHLICSYCDELLAEKSKLCLTGWVEVMDEKYECFLYLVGKNANGLETAHTVENIKSLYSA